MKFYKIQMLGRFIAEYIANVAGLSYSATLDKGRILYDETTNKLYYGNNSGGGQFSQVGGGAADVTYENLNANSDVGTGATQVSQGNHNHTGTYTTCPSGGQTDVPGGGSAINLPATAGRYFYTILFWDNHTVSYLNVASSTSGVGNAGALLGYTGPPGSDVRVIWLKLD